MTIDNLKDRVAHLSSAESFRLHARARSLKRQAEHLLEQVSAAQQAVRAYEAEQRSPDVVALRRAAAEKLTLGVEPLAPDLPEQVTRALDEIVADLTKAIEGTPVGDPPASVLEIRAHVRMFARHLGMTRADLAARLWAAPLTDLGKAQASNVGLDKLRDRCERLVRVGGYTAGVDQKAIATKLGDAVEVALGPQARRRVWPKPTPPSGAAGRIQFVPNLAATVAAERLLRDVFPRVLAAVRALAPEQRTQGAMQTTANDIIDEACTRLALRPGYLRAAVRPVVDSAGAVGLHLDYVACAEADQELLVGVLRELTAEHALVRADVSDCEE